MIFYIAIKVLQYIHEQDWLEHDFEIYSLVAMKWIWSMLRLFKDELNLSIKDFPFMFFVVIYFITSMNQDGKRDW